jgi:hypothetical protein
MLLESTRTTRPHNCKTSVGLILELEEISCSSGSVFWITRIVVDVVDCWVEEEVVSVKTNMEPWGNDEEKDDLFTATESSQPLESSTLKINSGQVDNSVGKLREHSQEGMTSEMLLPSSKNVEDPSNRRDELTFKKYKPCPLEMDETSVGATTVTDTLTGIELEIPSVANIVTRYEELDGREYGGSRKTWGFEEIDLRFMTVPSLEEIDQKYCSLLRTTDGSVMLMEEHLCLEEDDRITSEEEDFRDRFREEIRSTTGTPEGMTSTTWEEW